MRNKIITNIPIAILFLCPSSSFARYTDWQIEPESGSGMIFIFMLIAAGFVITDSFKKSKASGVIATTIVLILAYLFFTISKARTIITLAFAAWFVIGITYSFLKGRL